MIEMVATSVDRELLECLERASIGHRRLCPRQVLGVRMGRLAGVLLGLSLPQADKRLFTFVETDGCTVDGVVAATGCTVGRRTMRVLDFGKVAATFVDTVTGEAIRIRPHPMARERARAWAPRSLDDWHAMLEGYRDLPAEEILEALPVVLAVSMSDLIGRPGLRVPCVECGEEIMNGREVVSGERLLCRACSGEAYLWPTGGRPGPAVGTIGRELAGSR
jgi:formylmethanofuran dehydrogenase subunit E